MDTKELYREILNEHNVNPLHKEPMDDATIQLNGVNPSCGDNITLFLKTKDGKIESGSYQGSGCAVSQASCDMMLDLVIGKTTEEAQRLGQIVLIMIKGTPREEEIEELDEAGALKDISHMPSRVKCAVLGWRTLDEMLGLKKDTASAAISHPDCPV